MAKVVGTSDSLVFFSDNNKGVVVDKNLNLVVEVDDSRKLASSRHWVPSDEVFSDAINDLATGALASLDITVVASAGRMYTIPKGVQNEAKKALAWHKEFHRGGTPVGLNTARTLANGGQVGLRVIRHIAKYFPRHEVDKKAEGFNPGEKNFPSNGRIAWALWGSDAGWRWAQAIVERENKKAITADGYTLPGYVPDYSEYARATNYDADTDAFKDAYELGPMIGPTFMTRVRLDGSGMDRLYKIDLDGQVYVWDDANWDDLGHVDGDIWTYDKALDDPYDMCQKDWIVVDADSAVIISARLQQNPFTFVSVDDVDSDEAMLVSQALPDIDWDMVDFAITAVGAPVVPTDKVYTPEERSKNASSQVRDAGGKFAAQGARVVIGGDTQNGVGSVTAINPDTKNLTVKLDNGKTVEVPANTTQGVGAYLNDVAGSTTAETPPIDTNGILGQPRTPIDSPTAQIPGTLPQMTSQDLQDILNNFPAWVQAQRDAFVAGQAALPKGSPLPSMPKPTMTQADATKYQSDLEKQTGAHLALDAYQHPLLASWLNKTTTTPAGGTLTPNRLWYQPIQGPASAVSTSTPYAVTSAGEQKDAAPVNDEDTKAKAAPATELTPDTTDVQPIYAAVVSPDDPRAVLELISIVPGSSKSNTPMTYKRANGKWIRDDGILADLNSATPPPVVPLDSATLDSVLTQVDGVTASIYTTDHILTTLWGPRQDIMQAALVAVGEGGLDRDRGNAENLRRYWVHGKGALKIRWGTPGDWKRCVRHLMKYLGPRAKGYCQLRHHEATGMWTAQHAKLDRMGRGKHNSSLDQFDYPHLNKKQEMNPATDIPQDDLAMPLEQIAQENDPHFDSTWTPDDNIIFLLVNMLSDENPNVEDDQDPNMYAVTAAFEGGLDRNRGNAEKLRRYWLYGKGALKIRWNTPGDWTRCYHHLMKYMGPRAKGYCALRHHEATGMWTGDKKHLAEEGKKSKYHGNFSTELVSLDKFLENSYLNAKARDARNRMNVIASGELPTAPLGDGAGFTIPLVIPEDTDSGDGRRFQKGAIEMRDLPLPLMWQIKTADGHSGSVVVGRIDHMERTDEGIGNATGVFDTGVYGQEAERLVRNGFIRGVSADMDKFEAEEEASTEPLGEENKVGNSRLNITKARVMGVTIVPKPAFQECRIILNEDNNDTSNQEATTVLPDGVYVEDMDPSEAATLVACGFVAGAIPVVPPSDWFTDPKLQKATPLTVTDEGRVFGHIAAWHVDHIGMSFGTRPPRSKSKYAYFHTGVVRTDAGNDIPVGQLTLAGGHASLEASAQAAARHYDDTASAVADVHAGEDAHGIWVAGALRPSATPEQIRALRASAPSGDWRPIKGSLELVAVCQVNVPGFPIARARVASGQVMALVAAGASVLAKMKSDPVAELASRIEKLEQLELAELSAKADAVRARFAPMMEQKKAELTSRMTELSSRVKDEPVDMGDFTYISYRERKALAEKGQALPDGSFPIRNSDDLKNAIQSVGRAHPGRQDMVKSHIVKRARQLGETDMVPDEWKTAASNLEFTVKNLRQRLAAISASAGLSVDGSALTELTVVSQKTREHLAKTGAALPDGSYPIRNEKDLKNAIHAYGRSTKGDRAKVRSHIRKRAKSLGKEHLIPENWKAASIQEFADTPTDTETPVNLGKPSAVEVKDQPVQPKYNAETQPRDEKGKFSDVLARLGDSFGPDGAPKDIAEKIAETRQANEDGRIEDAAKAGNQLLEVVDRIDSHAMDPKALDSVREAAKELGSVIANLPLNFNDQTQVMRFSDLPLETQNLVRQMIDRVNTHIGQKDGDVATKDIRDFMSGNVMFNQSQVSSEMSKLLRILT